MSKLITCKNGSTMCPTCRTVFIESLDPQDIYVRNKEKRRRARVRAAKKGWKTRRGE